jgi:hypothetical protein
LTLTLWEVGDGPDTDGACRFAIATDPADVAVHRWGADVELGPSRGGTRWAKDRSGTVVGFVRTCIAPILLPAGYPATVAFSTITFATPGAGQVAA